MVKGVIDSHAHITSEQFNSDREEVLRRALDAGVEYIINPATDLEDSRRAIELAERYPRVYACVGFHPHEARKADEVSLREIEELSCHPKVVAIGEIGLDYYYDFSPRETQIEIFRAQIEIAKRRNLPIVIHTRDSIDDTIRVVEEAIAKGPQWRADQVSEGSRLSPPRGVFHCFSGDVDSAWRVIRSGFYVSFPGVVTFKKAGVMAEVASRISVEHVLLETDSPYLAPVPHRGDRNEPRHIPLIAEKVSELQGLKVADIVSATNYNVRRLFGIGPLPEPSIVYPLKDALYINLTIRCNADCTFCDRKGDAVIKGHNLKITREPTATEVIESIGDPLRYTEIVFCGYGEPTIRLDALKDVARWVKQQGGRTRLNTDGHGSIINKRNIVPELTGLIDAVSISLNSTDPEQYGALMRLDGGKYFAAMVEFAKEAVKLLPKVTMTIVDLEDVDTGKARAFVENEIGAVFQSRRLF